jgi:hypothetical protein
MPLIFSYGTLQQDNVQLSTFGRLLEGHGDELVGAEKSLLRIDDEKVVATSGRADHPVVRLNGLATSRVRGTVYEITDAELARADRYEVAAYKRVCRRACVRERGLGICGCPVFRGAIDYLRCS